MTARCSWFRAPLPRHQRAILNLADVLRAYMRAHGGEVLASPIDIVLSEFNVVQPDIVFFQASRQHVIHPDEPIRSGPDIAVEVLSPSTASTDRGRKMELLARYAIPEYWLVDPHGQVIEVYALHGDAYQLAQRAASGDIVGSARISRLECPVDFIFSESILPPLPF